MSKNIYGENTEWFLCELAATAKDSIDCDDIEVLGGDDKGNDGCASISIVDIAESASALIESMRKSISERDKEFKQAHIEADDLAMHLFDVHYKRYSTDGLHLIDSVSGVLSQIDNMTCGMSGRIRALEEAILSFKDNPITENQFAMYDLALKADR